MHWKPIAGGCRRPRRPGRGRQAILGYLGLDALDLGFAHGHINRRYPLHRRKRAQRMNQDGEAVEGEKLFGLWSGHPGAETRSGKNRKYLHYG